ncbi:hypothetical protein V8C42DRAFT_245133 [Trichoderma barbatum]
MLFTSASVPRQLLERQCQYHSTPPFSPGDGAQNGIAIMCVAFLTCFDALKLHTPKSASLGDRLRNAFRFSPCHLPPYLVPAPATFRASETQAAPGREKRSLGPPLGLVLLTRRCTMMAQNYSRHSHRNRCPPVPSQRSTTWSPYSPHFAGLTFPQGSSQVPSLGCESPELFCSRCGRGDDPCERPGRAPAPNSVETFRSFSRPCCVNL